MAANIMYRVRGEPSKFSGCFTEQKMAGKVSEGQETPTPRRFLYNLIGRRAHESAGRGRSAPRFSIDELDQ